MKGEATGPSPDRQGVGPLAEPVADARGSEIPGNSTNVTAIGLEATATNGSTLIDSASDLFGNRLFCCRLHDLPLIFQSGIRGRRLGGWTEFRSTTIRL
jgi:hypothetical protein